MNSVELMLSERLNTVRSELYHRTKMHEEEMKNFKNKMRKLEGEIEAQNIIISDFKEMMRGIRF